MVLGSGAQAMVEGTVADTKQSVLAVSSTSDKGFTTVFGPRGSFITRLDIPPPEDSEKIMRIGKHYYLEVRESARPASGSSADLVLAPAQEESQVAPPVQRPPEDEWDVAYKQAEAEGRPLPFGMFERTDDHAHRFRGIRKEDPCLFSSLIRRVTTDLTKLVVIEDMYKAEAPDKFSWRAVLPEAPRPISTKFYFYLGNRAGEELMDLAKPRLPALLKVPVKPSMDEVSRHMLTHVPFAPWCQDCVAGRSRGVPHAQFRRRK